MVLEATLIRSHLFTIKRGFFGDEEREELQKKNES